VKRDEGRVNVREMGRTDDREPEITGGYILKKDRLDPGDSGFFSKNGHLLAYVAPKETEITAAQRAWIKGYIDSFETVLYGGGFKNPTTGYAKYIDPDSFVDYHILEELIKNIDAFRLSTYYYKDRGGRLQIGPPWDNDLSLRNADYLEGWKPEGWYHDLIGDGDYPWWRRLFQDQDFAQRQADRWAELRAGPYATEALIGDIEATAALLQEAQVRNFQKWPILGVHVWPNPQPVPTTYKGEIDAMKAWLEARLSWIDSQFVAAPTLSPAGGTIVGGFRLTMTAPAGKIIYTLDGRDPRAAGGLLAPGVLTYTSPLALTDTAIVVARARVGAATIWSPPVRAAFSTGTPTLAVTEIMYHPADPPAGSPYLDEDFEFVEIRNVGNGPVSLLGVRLAMGISFDFTSGAVKTLEPGAHVLVVKDAAAFATRYETSGLAIAGEFDGNLENSGDPIRLVGPLGETIAGFAYQDGWYPETDGAGRSLVLRSGTGLDPGMADSWRASVDDGGSPGLADPLGGLQQPGDVNADGILDISDPVALLEALFLGSTKPLPCEGDIASEGNRTVVDASGDGAVDISDGIRLLGFLFIGGAPPALGTDCLPVSGCARDRCAP